MWIVSGMYGIRGSLLDSQQNINSVWPVLSVYYSGTDGSDAGPCCNTGGLTYTTRLDGVS